MVKGSTYFVRFTPNPERSLEGYTGSYKVIQNNDVIEEGDMPVVDDKFELSVQTASYKLGKYRFQAFANFPDGFIQNIHDETVDII